jgi:hypothetical protein
VRAPSSQKSTIAPDLYPEIKISGGFSCLKSAASLTLKKLLTLGGSWLLGMDACPEFRRASQFQAEFFILFRCRRDAKKFLNQAMRRRMSSSCAADDLGLSTLRLSLSAAWQSRSSSQTK